MSLNFDYIGHPQQIYGATPITYSQGKAKGVKAVQVRNGAGLELTVLEDRCLDISQLSFKGFNMSYMSKCGIVGPEYYNSREFEFLQSFNVGFLTSCGLRHIGAPCSVNGESFGLHGRIGNTPAEEVCAFVEQPSGATPTIRVNGRIREGRIFRENLELFRSIEIPVGQNHFVIHNQIRNNAYVSEPYMFMLHINFGYPFLSEHTRLFIPSANTQARDARAEEGLDHYQRVEAPQTTFDEQVYFHQMSTRPDGQTAVGIINTQLQIGLVLRYSGVDFPFTTQWNQFAKGDYVLGIEPASCKMVGRSEALKENIINTLEPQSSKDFDVRVDFLDGPQEIDAFQKDFISWTSNRK